MGGQRRGKRMRYGGGGRGLTRLLGVAGGTGSCGVGWWAGGRLVHANLEGAILRRAKLDRADAGRANLTRAHLDAASLRSASLHFATLSGATVPPPLLPLFRLVVHTGFCQAVRGENEVARLVSAGRALLVRRWSNRPC
jgi:hypothetical protein